MEEEGHVDWKRKEVLSFNEMERGKMVISIVNGKLKVFGLIMLL